MSAKIVEHGGSWQTEANPAQECSSSSKCLELCFRKLNHEGFSCILTEGSTEMAEKEERMIYLDIP